MARSYSEAGLKPGAHEWLAKSCVTVGALTCPHCGKAISEDRQPQVYETEHVDCFYDDGPNLATYHLLEGGYIKEVLQAAPWASGPTAFFCLELEGGERLFEWTEEEIEEYL